MVFFTRGEATRENAAFGTASFFFFSLNIFILNYNVTCNTNIHTIIIYRIGTEAHSL